MHRAAAAGFAASAPQYERGRPGYPDEAVHSLASELGLGEGRTVVDLAAGTGKLSRPLAVTGARVIAVEPIAEMRALIGPPIEAVEGTAEEIPLPAGSADALTVAQAFHWFDRSGHWRTAFERTILFGPLVEQHFSNSQELDADGLAMRFGSVSFVAALPDRERSEVDERLRALAADGPATITYVTELFTCRRL